MEKLKAILVKYRTVLFVIFLFLFFFIFYNHTAFFRINSITVSSINGDDFKYIDLNGVNSELNRFKGQKFFNLDIVDLEKTVHDNSAYVENLYVEKIFPNKISLTISERNPYLILDLTKNCIVMDVNAYVLEINEEEDCTKYKSETVYVKSDETNVPFKKGEVSNYNQLGKIVNVIKVLNEFNFTVKQIFISKNVGSFVIDKNKIIVFSFDIDIKSQLARLVAVLNEIGKNSYKYNTIDVRFERPVIKN